MGHGRIESRDVAILPAHALSGHMRAHWPTVSSIARISRHREHVRQGQTVKSETETIYLISSLKSPDPKYVLQLNRDHWKIEIMHRDKDVTLGEDRYTNRSGHAPRNIFTLTSAARTLLKRIEKSPTRAIEIVQDNRDKAVRLITDQAVTGFL